MEEKLEELIVYDTVDCMNRIKRKYPLIPIGIIRRVLYAEELYMKEIGIINYNPRLDMWVYKKNI
ncbi:MAG: hypothetical protein MJZ37_10580 [Bacilli bacterium]|nr:hypothetical protein [Bacilli bacterium]